MTDPLLPPTRIVALSNEIDEVVALLAHGRAVLANTGFSMIDEPVVFVCLAGGAEKLLKLSLGLAGLDIDDAWPDMRRWNHRITAMDAECRRIIRERMHLSPAPGHPTQLLDKAERDDVLAAVLEVVTTYAMAGRFHNLDTLGASEPLSPSPRELWEKLVSRLGAADPAMLRGLADPKRYQSARLQLNDRIVRSIELWHKLYFRAWQHGILGWRGRMWSSQLLIGLDLRRDA